MERKLYAQLLEWKNKADRQPLIINGARQVGKTYTALTFGKENYKNVVYINFEGAKDIAAIFERNLDPKRIVAELAVAKAASIIPGDTLIVFDEIQACERALTSLKYFCEEAPEYHIIAAGSLLGTYVHREKYSFPVGKVQLVKLCPMDFEEFLWALGERQLAELIREHYAKLEPFALHDKALDLYKLYLVVGGMPRAVEEYVRSKDLNFVISIQKGLNDSYIADMAKYADEQETTRIMATWNSIPAQLAKENRKFQYKVIKSGARANVYEGSLAWLAAAGLISKCQRVNIPSFPLNAFADVGAFKVYMVDTGLLCSKFDIPPHIILNGGHVLDSFKGALTENYVMQALGSSGKNMYYWTKDSRLEIDFLLQNEEGDVIPVECKSSEHVRDRSLTAYMQMFKPRFGMRISARNFGFENSIKSVPLYACFCI